MPIFLKGKAKYVKSQIDSSEHCLTTGHFLKYLQSRGINSVAEYVIQHECPPTRPLCQVCGKHAKQEGVDGTSWKFVSTCGDKECAVETRRRGRKAVTREQEAESVRKRNKTFAEKPELLQKRSKLAHGANLKVGEDGLTGYERTKKKREQTLLEKHGRKDFANWQKSAETWKQKSDESIKEHAEKIRSSWKVKPDDIKRGEIARREQAKLDKYGIPGWKIAFNGSKGRRSKLSDTFCNFIQAKIKEPLIYGTKELNLQNNFFDLTSTSRKKIIEFNGDYWHANPKKYHSNETITLKGGRTAKEIWEADAKKIALAEANGYQVKVVWESDYKKNPEIVIKECIEWLKS
jgi:hypothetical protein